MQDETGEGQRTVRAETFALLRSFGMTTVFGNPGSTELAFLRDWPADFRYVLGLQEASVLSMADGFAQASRRPVLVNLHATAGMGNAMGNLFAAQRNKAPLVILAGQQSRPLLSGRPYLAGEVPRDLPRPFVKSSVEPARAEDVPEAIHQAILLAMQPPFGPTFVSVPSDDWDVPATPVMPRRIEAGFTASPAALQALADVLGKAERPALVAGPGIDREGAWDAFVALAERLQAGVWISPVTSRVSFPGDHPLFMGFLPPLRERIADALAPCDAVLVVGAPLFTYHVPSADHLSAMADRFHLLTDDPQEAAGAAVGTALLTTLTPALGELARLIPDVARIAPTPRGAPPQTAPAYPLEAPFVLQALGRHLSRDTVIVAEAPSHRGILQNYIPTRMSGGYYTTGSGGMGFGLPAAVGVALADPSRRVVAVLGDGASQFSIQALWSAAQLALPILFVVLNNGAYAAMNMLGRMQYDGTIPGVDLPGIDMVALAQGYGCAGARVDRPEDLEAAFATALAADGPFLLDVIVAPPKGALY